MIASQVNNDRLIFSSVFSSDKTYYENISQHPPRPRKISSSPFVARLVTNGQILISTLASQKDYAPVFMETASSIWLPIKKEKAVIAIIELGSEKIIETHEREEHEASRALMLPYEKLLRRISRILEKRF